MLTNAEVLALDAILADAIIKSKSDDGDPVFHEVAVNDVNPFGDKQTQSDVYIDLAQQGLIQCSGTDDPSDGEIIEYVCITPEGLDALKVTKGLH